MNGWTWLSINKQKGQGKGSSRDQREQINCQQRHELNQVNLVFLWSGEERDDCKSISVCYFNKLALTIYFILFSRTVVAREQTVHCFFRAWNTWWTLFHISTITTRRENKYFKTKKDINPHQNSNFSTIEINTTRYLPPLLFPAPSERDGL